VAAALLGSGLAACGGSDAANPPTRGQIKAMLGAHARAVRHHDRPAFLAGVGTQPAAANFRRAQTSEIANLDRVPLTTWRYTLGPRAQAPGAQASARRRFGPSAVIYRVTLTYALRGVDEHPTSHDLSWTFARSDGQVVAVDDTALAAVGGASWRGPWDFGPLTVVTSTHALVLGHPQDAELLRTLARTVDAAVPVVTSVWGGNWSQDVLVLVPATSAELAADLGPVVNEAAPVAAIATSDGTDPVSGDVLGERIVVDPRRLAGVGSIGLRILMQHEVTHVADAAATGASTPTWLSEGFAEYVGNLHSGQRPSFAAAELARQVRRGRLLRALPTSAQFADANAALAYQASWLACRLIAARIGPRGLVALYRAVGRSQAAPATAAAGALRRFLHESPAQFVGQWRAYLRSVLGAAR
jgi:hypothetical protein